MRKILSKIAGLALGLSLAAGVGLVAGGKKAERVHAADFNQEYKLDGTVTASGNAYATASTVTQNGIGWKVVGNTEQSPWRIGGKGLTKQDREIYSTTAISANIAKIEVSSGATASSLSVNSLTITVHSTAADAQNGSNAVATKTVTSGIANSTVAFEKTDSSSWENKFYRIVYNVTRTGTSGNGYITFNSATFYSASAHNHSWVAGTVHAPTCTEAGYTEYECSECHETKQDDVTAALGHDYGAWTQVTAPTCLTAGEERRVCSHDSSHIETRPISALGHSYVDGICERCGAEEPNETTVGYVFSEHYSANTALDDVVIAIDENISVVFATTGTATQYYTNGTAVRMYSGATMTISSSAGNISSVTITFLSKHDNAITADVGSYTDSASVSGTGSWVGDSNTVVFTEGGSSGHDRISELSITYDHGSDPVVTYTITYLANAADAEGSMSPTTASSPQVAACSFTRDGYEFARWNTQADGEGDDYSVGASVSEDLTLYVIWQEYVAPIEGNVSMEGVTSYSAVTVNGHPALKCGANSTAGSMKLVLSNASISKIKVYVAGWKGDAKTINIEASGCTVTEESITVTEDSAITGSTTAFTLTGVETTYRFVFNVSNATAGAEITLTAAQASKNRFVVWGATDLFAESFASEFNSNLACDATGEDGPSFTSGHDWTTMNSFYNGLDAEEKGRLHDATFTVSGSGSSTVVTATGDTVQSVAEAMARYDYIIAKYGTSEYTNFIGRSVTKLAPARIVDGTISSSSSTIIIVIVALTSITSIGVLLVIKRRRSLVK